MSPCDFTEGTLCSGSSGTKYLRHTQLDCPRASPGPGGPGSGPGPDPNVRVQVQTQRTRTHLEKAV